MNHRPTVAINAGQTLVSIAEQYFQDRSLSWLIADLNADQTWEQMTGGKRIVEVQDGQRLVLPDFQDIMKFKQERQSKVSPDSLETIVIGAQAPGSSTSVKDATSNSAIAQVLSWCGIQR